jgi:hypothetical protein
MSGEVRIFKSTRLPRPEMGQSSAELLHEALHATSGESAMPWPTLCNEGADDHATKWPDYEPDVVVYKSIQGQNKDCTESETKAYTRANAAHCVREGAAQYYMTAAAGGECRKVPDVVIGTL